MKSKTCCFTGHRRLPEKEQTIVKCKLEDSVESLIQNGYRYFGAGGAIGFDYEKGKVMKSNSPIR